MNISKSLKVKRSLDIVASLLGLVLLSPIIGSIALGTYIAGGRPILFCQRRPGLRGTLFTLYKFRTMRIAASNEVWFRSDDARLSEFGRLIRKLSLDELPSLWNVLKGELSLVGPRPLLEEYMEKYTPAQLRRHNVPPGITGWVQVMGRQNLRFSERLRLDIFYVDNWSNWVDLRILGITLIQLFKPIGVIPGQNVDDVDDLGLSPDRPNR